MSSPRARESADAPATFGRLRTDVFLMVATKGLALVLGLVTSVVLARGLGASGRGTLAVAFNMTLLLVQVGTFGITSANPYFVARDPAHVGRIVWNSIAGALALGVLFIGVGLAIRGLFPGVLAGVTWAQAAVGFSAIPAALASGFLQSVLLGQGRMLAYNVTEATWGVLAVVALVAGFAVLDMGVLGALAVLVVQQVAMALTFVVLLAPELRHGARPDLPLARRMMAYSFRIYVATLAAYLVVRIDMLLVNGMLGAAEAGRYTAAVALADGMGMIPVAIGVNLFPRVARGGATDTSAEVFRAVGLLFGLLCLISIPFAEVVINVLYGPGFGEAASLFLWLLPGIYCLGMVTILSHHFAGRGFPLEAMLVWFVALAIDIAINLAFLRSHGTAVAAIASSVAYGALYVMHVAMFARETGGVGALRPRFGETAQMVRTALSRTPATS
ncbi:MAG: oligosaccharide flippase family protein [Actinobacteria bacterium]|nr:oligosaccharide flippase family protein [Actinomycetota bacterium]